MDPKLVVYLLGTLRKCADVDAGGPGEARVLAFVECFESKQDHTLLTRRVGLYAWDCRPVMCKFTVGLCDALFHCSKRSLIFFKI